MNVSLNQSHPIKYPIKLCRNWKGIVLFGLDG